MAAADVKRISKRKRITRKDSEKLKQITREMIDTYKNIIYPEIYVGNSDVKPDEESSYPSKVIIMPCLNDTNLGDLAHIAADFSRLLSLYTGIPQKSDSIIRSGIENILRPGTDGVLRHGTDSEFVISDMSNGRRNFRIIRGNKVIKDIPIYLLTDDGVEEDGLAKNCIYIEMQARDRENGHDEAFLKSFANYLKRECREMGYARIRAISAQIELGCYQNRQQLL